MNFQFFLNITAIMCIVAIINYWLLVPTAIMTILFYLIRSVYVNTGRSVKRIEALSKFRDCLIPNSLDISLV